MEYQVVTTIKAFQPQAIAFPIGLGGSGSEGSTEGGGARRHPTPLSLLVNSGHKSPSVLGGLTSQWSRRQRRLFHRSMSGIEFGLVRGDVVRVLTLTSAPGSPDIHGSWGKFVKRVRRRLDSFEYLSVVEHGKGGLKHIHILFKGGFLSQSWVSRVWGEIHKAPIVYIQRFRGGKKRLGAYLSKYLGKEMSGANRFWTSWRWVYFGFVGDWNWLVRKHKRHAVERWLFWLRNGVGRRLRPYGFWGPPSRIAMKLR